MGKTNFLEGPELAFGLQNGSPEWRHLLPWTLPKTDRCLPLLFPLPPRPCNKYWFGFERVVPGNSTNRRHKACENMTLGHIVSAQGTDTNRENTGPWDKSFQRKALGTNCVKRDSGTNRSNTRLWDKSFQHKAQAGIV